MSYNYVLRDPITESKIEVYGWNALDYTEDRFYGGMLSFRIYKSTPFFNKIKEQPIRLQGYPFFLDIPLENRTELIVVQRVANGFNVTDDCITALGCEIKYLDNLEFFKKIQHQRWMYNDND